MVRSYKKYLLVFAICSAQCLAGNLSEAFAFASASVQDTDGDGIPDIQDIDDDNDGIVDIIEICETLESAPAGLHLKVVIGTDANPGQTSWEVEYAQGHLTHGGPYTGAYEEYIHEFELPEAGYYSFAIDDSAGNGMDDEGYYKVYLNGELMISGGGAFGYADYAEFDAQESSGPACIPADPSEDSDNDGIPNYADADFCTLNAYGVCADMDFDSDGLPNFLDLDSDNDGIPDMVEAQATHEFTLPTGWDADADGLDDAFDAENDPARGAQQSRGIIPVNTDSDVHADYLDTDSDGDGHSDNVESGIVLTNTDNDHDGLDGAADAADQYALPWGTIHDMTVLPDSDNDIYSGGDVDFRDADSAPEDILTGIFDGTGPSAVSIYPNPVRTNARLHVQGLDGLPGTAQFIAADGRLTGSFAVDASGTIDLSGQTLSAGTYFIQINGSETVHTATAIITE